MMALSGSISRWSEKFVLRGEEEGVVNVVSVSSYQQGGLCRLAPPRKIKWHACALSLAQANAPSSVPIGTDLAFQMHPLSHH